MSTLIKKDTNFQCSKVPSLVVDHRQLPVEERVSLVDSPLLSLNQPELEIDKKWAKEAKRHLTEIRNW